MKLEVKLVSENLAHARGGEVVLYKRGDSTRWQARYKLKDLKWHRTATKHVSAPVAKDAKSTSSAEQAKTEVGKQPTQQQSQLIQAKPTQTIVQHPQLISNQQVANAIPATPRKIQQPIQSVEKNSSCMISVALVEFMSERDKEKRKDFIERDTHQSKTCGNEA